MCVWGGGGGGGGSRYHFEGGGIVREILRRGCSQLRHLFPDHHKPCGTAVIYREPESLFRLRAGWWILTGSADTTLRPAPTTCNASLQSLGLSCANQISPA